MPRRNRVTRRRGRRGSANRQLFRETGQVSIRAQESYNVHANDLEIPIDRAFTALTISTHLTANAPIIVQIELWGPNNRPVWRCQPISVGLIPIRRIFRWPAKAAAMWQSGSQDTILKIVCPCPGKIFGGSYVQVNYTITCQLSADYDQQICPKQHGVIERLIDEFDSVELVS